jgi:RecA-family ATPase/DNA polymerase I-like protein with 3'-5' exonuclease and polymerase domains
MTDRIDASAFAHLPLTPLGEGITDEDLERWADVDESSPLPVFDRDFEAWKCAHGYFVKEGDAFEAYEVAGALIGTFADKDAACEAILARWESRSNGGRLPCESEEPRLGEHPSFDGQQIAIPIQEAAPARRHTNFLRLASRYVNPAIGKPEGLRLAFDIETDGLLGLATRVHCIEITDIDSNRVDAFRPDQIDAGLARLAEATTLGGHNNLNFDLRVLQRLHGWSPRPAVTIVDTLIASRLTLADITDLDDRAAAMGDPKLGKLRGRHSLEAWGARLGIPKVGAGIDDYSHWSPELQERCAADVRITKALFHFLQPSGQPAAALALEHRVASVCEQITADGMPFDHTAAEQLAAKWTARRNELESRLRQQFPQTTNLNSRLQIARLLEARGWVPEERTEKTRQPKINDEALEDIIRQYPEFDGLSEHYILGRRLAQLATGAQAWLHHIGPDGRIHGGIIHIGTPHHRAKHLAPNLAQVPNPKKAKPFAAECRALFRTNNDWMFVGCDQAGLQDRCFAHHLAEFDGGAYARTFSNGTKTHWQSAIALGLIPAGTERDKENKVHSIIYEGAKRFFYAFLYGAGTARLGAIIADIVRDVQRIDPNSSLRPLSGSVARQRFMDGVPGLGRLRQTLDAQHAMHEWVVGLDGRRVPTGAQYKALNRLVTNSEAIICKRWLVDVDDALHAQFRYGWDGDVVLVGWIHDELVACCRPEIADQVGEIMVRYAKEAGHAYGFKVPLDADYQVGQSWAGDPINNGDAHRDLPEIATEPAVEAATAPASRQEPKPELEPAPEPELHVCVFCQSEILLEANSVKAYNGGWLHAYCQDPFLRRRMAEEGISWDAEAQQGADTSTKPPPKSEATTKPNGQSGHQAGSGSRTAAAEDTYAEENDGEPFDDSYLLRQGYAPRLEFNYALPDGTLVTQQLRYELRNDIAPTKKRPRKRFLPRHKVNGAWILGGGKRRVLFNWPGIVQAGPGATVIVTEGERNATELISAGLLATTVLSHKWAPECVAALTGYHLIILEDHDDDGRRLAEDARSKLAAVAASIRVVPYAHLWKQLPPNAAEPALHDDVSDWIKQGGDPARLIEICREIPSVRFMIAPIRDWDDKPAPEIGYGVDGRFPLEVVNLFSGEGGSGKSTTTHQLAVAHTLEREWLGVTPRKGPAIYVECEDPIKALHWRQHAIAKHYGVTQAAIADAGFVMLPWADEKEPAILATAPDKSGIIHPTPLYDELYAMAGDLKPIMIGIASAAIVFAGNENVRPEVQQFMWLLRRLTRVSGGYVLLVSQPSLTGIGDSSDSHAGLSGTTQWHNGARGRAVLRAIKPQGSDTDTGLREIRFYKNQYGAISSSCYVRYNGGLLLPVDGMVMGGAERAAKAEEVFILLLKKFTAQKQTVNHLEGRNYAPKQFAEQTEAAGIDKKELKAAMQRLLDAGVIEIRELPGRPSRPSVYLAMKGT